MKLGLRVKVLTGKPQWCVRPGVIVPGGGTPKRGLCAPSSLASFGNELCRGANEISNNREESLVDFTLGSGRDIGEFDLALGLAKRYQILVIPSEGDGFAASWGTCGLFGEGGAIPREVDLLSGRIGAGCESLFGYSAAEGIVEVAPGESVGGDDGGEAVLGVPGVVPGVGFAGEAGFLAERYSTEIVVFVADRTGFGDAGAGVGAFAPGRGVGVAVGPGGVSLVVEASS